MKPSIGADLRRHFTYSNVMSSLAVFLVLAGGTAIAVTGPANSVNSKTVKNNTLRSVDLKNGKGVTGADVTDASLSGADVADSSLAGADVTDGSLSGIDIADGGINTADLANNAVNSAKVLDNSLTGADVAADTLSGADVAADSLTGADILETTLGQVPSAANSSLLGGKSSASFVSSSTYRKESAVEAGTTLGDGTQFIDQGCEPGDELLSGGPANINDTTDLLESFPSSTVTWRARVNKNAATDNFSVVVLCANQ